MEKQDFILIEGYKHIRYIQKKFDENEMIKRASDFFNYNNQRRSIRDFSDKPVPFEIIENIIKTASTAPSGANKQPWTFCVVKSPEIKKKIRIAAEVEEQKSYEERMSDEWLDDLKHLGTDANKPFLEKAPYLIIVFKRPYEVDGNGEKCQNYYVNESVGLACGFLISAIHNAGLVTLTHTPSPMRFLEKILNRPSNERAFLVLPVGYEAEKTYVPDIERKALNDVMELY
ncbi:nitroreductase family protein [Lutibacter sp.]|uniref:nitroreductase family protein n=1 Tax=Lutibacter sp. TaxID=1925666 RepID=UPI0027351BBC|nr:nitroreductase family protein [Lutibacter sp.]MDP3312213.1 nitroreductase family protein [Lutibacter sp.]